jgi:ABC-type lipoprotein release transport system permease subunit
VQTLRHAWRNLWRNGRRTAITLTTVALATAVLIVIRALMAGMMRDAIRNATDLGMGEVQIHAPGWLRDPTLHAALPDPEGIAAVARARGVAAAPRALGSALLAHGVKSSGALMWGVEPAREREAFSLARHVDRGAFLAAAPGRSVVLGRKLARILDVDVGSELVVVVQGADGSLGNDLFTVTGVLKSVGDAFDRSAALVHRADFAELFVAEGLVHELALTSRGRLPLDTVAEVATAAAPGQEVRTWRQLVPALSDMLGMADAALWIFGGIFFVAAGLGVLNTMLMATHERVREFGLVKALGASPARILRDVAVEALILAVTGTALGAAAGVAAARALEVHGIDTSALAGDLSFAGVAFDPVWRAALSPAELVVPIVVMWLAAVVAALWPGFLAARLDPVRAMERT